MSQRLKLAIMVHEGGTHSNLKAIKDAAGNGKINAQIVSVITDAEEPMPLLEEALPDYICLAGWKKIIPDSLLTSYKNRILNIHPGLIPDTMDGNMQNPDGTRATWNKGMYGQKAIKNFLDQKATYAGSSVHFLTDEFDFGPVLGRVFEKIEPNDTVESLYVRLKEKENELYVEVLKKLANEKI